MLTGTTANFVVSYVDIAITNNVCKDSFLATVSNPPLLILVPGVTAAVPEEFPLTLQVTVLGGLYVPATEAVN